MRLGNCFYVFCIEKYAYEILAEITVRTFFFHLFLCCYFVLVLWFGKGVLCAHN